MSEKKETSKAITPVAFMAILLCITMIIFPETTITSSRKSIELWQNNIIPALFPFFIFTNLLINLGITRHLPKELFTFIMSLMSGYPMGAKIIAELYTKGEIRSKKAKHLLSFCCTTGPAFLIGTVGTCILSSKKAGYIIAISHYAGSLLNGILFYIILYKGQIRSYSDDILPASTLLQKMAALSVFSCLTEAIYKALVSMGIILAYIIIFLYFADLITELGVFAIMRKDVYKGFIMGIMEMSIGAFTLGESSNISISLKIMLLSFLISFGGLSVAGQSMSMLSETDISFRYYIAVKLSHGILSALVAVAMLHIFC